MDHDTFKLLVDTLREKITFNVAMARLSAPHMEPIYPELVCAIGLRYLAGRRKHDIMHWAEVSASSYYRCRNTFIDAVLDEETLEIKFPMEPDELDGIAEGFERISNNDGQAVFNKCVGCVDGMLALINQRKYQTHVLTTPVTTSEWG